MKKKHCTQSKVKNWRYMLKNDYGINLSNRFEITANNMQDKELNHVFDYFVNTLNGQIICQQAETNWVQTLLNE